VWFILLFTICALAIPIAMEIHVKGSDNILTRSGQELLRSRAVRRVAGLLGLTRDWIFATLTVVAMIVFVVIILKSIGWLARHIF
jgi:hypothetical protein